MRIISGLYKNRVLKMPKGDTTRPTSAKLRGSIFDILQNQIEGKSFLDLFAGSGSMGIEALSRGASTAVFVEKDRGAAHCIKENLGALEIEAQLLQMDAWAAVKRLIKDGKQFDIIYIDPPYTLKIDTLLGEIAPLLAPLGIVVLEQSKRAILSQSSLKILDARHFGDTTIYFLSH